MKKDLKVDIEVPENVEVEIAGKKIVIKSKGNEVERTFLNPRVSIKKEDGKVVLFSKNATKREKTTIGTFTAHISNMIKGVNEGFEYKLKICSSHFPMSVGVEENKVLIKNFLGEKIPRKARIMKGVEVKIEGDEIVVKGNDIESVGQTAANIEQACKINNRDRRVFQDGCYITKKAKGEII